METFSKIFATSVEAAISRVLPEVIEKAVDAKLREEMISLREEIQELRSMLTSQSRESADRAVSREHAKEVRGPVADKPSTGMNAEKSDRLTEELSALLKVLKEIRRPVKAGELRSLLPEIKWGSNPAVKLSNLMIKSNGLIQRVGKGFYQYANSAE